MLHPLLEESELHDWEVAVAAQILYPPKFLMTLAHCCFSSFSLLSEFLSMSPGPGMTGVNTIAYR